MKEEESPEDPKPTKWPLFIEEKTRKLALKEEPDLPVSFISHPDSSSFRRVNILHFLTTSS
jgi:hypothetical protein